MKKLIEFLKSADSWMFGYGSTHTMAVLRILYGTLAFINFARILPSFGDWLTETGFIPAEASRQMFSEGPRINVFSVSTDARVTLGLYLFFMVCSVCVALGLFSRITTVLLAIGLISFHHRTGPILHGGDTMLRQMAIYVACMASGNVWSLDRLIALKRGLPDPALKSASAWPVRLATLQIAIVYFTTVWHKWNGDYWRDGTAVWYPLRLGEFSRFWLPDFCYMEWFVKLTTYGTLATELALATLVFFRPFRKWVLIAGIGMHGFIEYSMNIPLFAFIMVSAYVSFYDGEETRSWVAGVKARMANFRSRSATHETANVQRL
jgi:hypothetical protein